MRIQVSYTASQPQLRINHVGELLQGNEEFIFAHAGYRGVEKHTELKDASGDWYIAERPRKISALKKHPRKNKLAIHTEYLKASVRAKVEHPFRIIKCQFGFAKARYRGLMKNDSKPAMPFALANVVQVDQMLKA